VRSWPSWRALELPRRFAEASSNRQIAKPNPGEDEGARLGEYNLGESSAKAAGASFTGQATGCYVARSGSGGAPRLLDELRISGR
jgi:hypothetical protein